MRKSAKLKLCRETVRLLNPPDLAQAQGQGPTFTCTAICETISCVTCGALTCGLECQPRETLAC